MSYTESEKTKTLCESKEERNLKNYFKSLQTFGDDFASRSLVVKGDMINSMRLFSSEDIASTSDEIAILMIKNSLLTYNRSKNITLIKRLMLKDVPIETIVDFVLVCKTVKLELSKNMYYQRESNPVNQFNTIYRTESDETKERILGCIEKLNSYMESIKEENKKSHNNEIIPLKTKTITKKELKKTA